MLFSGSADLYGSTKNYIKSAPDFEPETADGRNIWFSGVLFDAPAHIQR